MDQSQFQRRLSGTTDPSAFSPTSWVNKGFVQISQRGRNYWRKGAGLSWADSQNAPKFWIQFNKNEALHPGRCCQLHKQMRYEPKYVADLQNGLWGFRGPSRMSSMLPEKAAGKQDHRWERWVVGMCWTNIPTHCTPQPAPSVGKGLGPAKVLPC